MFIVLSQKFAISNRKFLFQLQAVILTLFLMTPLRVIPDKIEREGSAFAQNLLGYLLQRIFIV